MPDHGVRARRSGHSQAPSYPLPIPADSVARSRGTAKTTLSPTVCCGPASPSSYPHVSTRTYAFSRLHVSYVTLAVGSAVVYSWLIPSRATAVFGLLLCARSTPPAVLLYNARLSLGLARPSYAYVVARGAAAAHWKAPWPAKPAGARAYAAKVHVARCASRMALLTVLLPPIPAAVLQELLQTSWLAADSLLARTQDTHGNAMPGSGRESFVTLFATLHVPACAAAPRGACHTALELFCVG